MKRLIILILLFSLGKNLFSQIQSNCTDNAALIANAYEKEINTIAVNRLFEIQHIDTNKVIVPQIHKDSILKAFVGVFNLGSQLDADSVFKKYCIQDYHSSINSIVLLIDTSENWTNAWQNMQTSTTNTQLNQLLNTYGFSITNYSSSSNTVTLSSNTPLNIKAFGDSLIKIPGIYSYWQNFFAGGGNSITYDIIGSNQRLNFYLKWGGCPAGCMNYKAWKYNIGSSCTITMTNFLSINSNSNRPNLQNCNLGPSSTKNSTTNQFKIFPNPTFDYLTIATKGKGILKLTSISGKKILLQNIFQGNNKLNISSLANGIYFVSIKTNTGTSVQKIIKQ